MKATATTRATTVKGMPTKKSVKQLILQSVAAPKLARVSSGFKTDLGELVVGDCLAVLRNLPDNSVDLVVTSPPYDGQPKYGNGEKYERDWYRGFFMQVTEHLFRDLHEESSIPVTLIFLAVAILRLTVIRRRGHYKIDAVVGKVAKNRQAVANNKFAKVGFESTTDPQLV